MQLAPSTGDGVAGYKKMPRSATGRRRISNQVPQRAKSTKGFTSGMIYKVHSVQYRYMTGPCQLPFVVSFTGSPCML